MIMETIPKRLYSSRLLTGAQEFSCALHLPEIQTLDPGGYRLSWSLDGWDITTGASLSGTRIVERKQVEAGRIRIDAILPEAWQGGRLSAKLESSEAERLGSWEVKPFHQVTEFLLPLEGQVLVLGGHRIGEVHRGAWQIPSQQFAWDLLPMDDQGLGLLSGSCTELESPEDFFGFGQRILAPQSGRVARAVDDLPDLPKPGELPDPAVYLKDLELALGNHLVLEHEGGVWSFFGHLRQGSLHASVGQTVEKRAVLGELGNSGFSSGPHLHLHFMDGPDPLTASPLPVALMIAGTEHSPQAGEIL